MHANIPRICVTLLVFQLDRSPPANLRAVKNMSPCSVDRPDVRDLRHGRALTVSSAPPNKHSHVRHQRHVPIRHIHAARAPAPRRARIRAVRVRRAARLTARHRREARVHRVLEALACRPSQIGVDAGGRVVARRRSGRTSPHGTHHPDCTRSFPGTACGPTR